MMREISTRLSDEGDEFENLLTLSIANQIFSMMSIIK